MYVSSKLKALQQKYCNNIRLFCQLYFINFALYPRPKGRGYKAVTRQTGKCHLQNKDLKRLEYQRPLVQSNFAAYYFASTQSSEKDKIPPVIICVVYQQSERQYNEGISISLNRNVLVTRWGVRQGIAVLQKESSPFKGEVDVKL